MSHRLRLLIGRLRTRLWVRPLALTVLALAGVGVAALADLLPFGQLVPTVRRETLDDLLTVVATSMLSVATFAVASMVAAYASAGSSATPRAFALVVADDVSQTALSGFIGAFIFSLVALSVVKSQALGAQGMFVLACLLAGIFAVVIVLFLWWVDGIARLGRLGSTIERVERAASAALRRRVEAPTLGAAPAAGTEAGRPVHAPSVGYVQAVDIAALQAVAERDGITVVVTAMPGAFVAPGRPLARVVGRDAPDEDLERAVARGFTVGQDRTFDDDPRFGFVALAEIASRALSPAVNDPGTAIQIIGAFVRLFVQWSETTPDAVVTYPRVQVPPLRAHDLFEDAFTSVPRDGAGFVEVGVRLQKAFQSIAAVGDPTLSALARTHAGLALARAESALTFQADLERVRAEASRLLSAR